MSRQHDASCDEYRDLCSIPVTYGAMPLSLVPIWRNGSDPGRIGANLPDKFACSS